MNYAAYSSLIGAEFHGSGCIIAAGPPLLSELSVVVMDRELIERRINAICGYKGRKASATRCVEMQNLSLTTRPLRTVAC